MATTPNQNNPNPNQSTTNPAQPTPSQPISNQAPLQQNQSTEESDDTAKLIDYLNKMFEDKTSNLIDFEKPTVKTKLGQTIIDSLTAYENRIFTNKDLLAKKRVVYYYSLTKTILNRIFGQNTINNFAKNINTILDSVANMETILLDINDIKKVNITILQALNDIISSGFTGIKNTTQITTNKAVNNITKTISKTIKDVSENIKSSVKLSEERLFGKKMSRKGFFDTLIENLENINYSINRQNLFNIFKYGIKTIFQPILNIKNDIDNIKEKIENFKEQHPKIIEGINNVVNKFKEEIEKSGARKLISDIGNLYTDAKTKTEIIDRLQDYISLLSSKKPEIISNIDMSKFINKDLIEKATTDINSLTNKELKEFLAIMKKVKFAEKIEELTQKMNEVKISEDERNRLKKEIGDLIGKEYFGIRLIQLFTGIKDFIGNLMIGITSKFKVFNLFFRATFRSVFNIFKTIFNFGGKIVSIAFIITNVVLALLQEYGSGLLHQILFGVGFIIGFISRLIKWVTDSILGFFKDENGEYLTFGKIVLKILNSITKFITDKFSGFGEYVLNALNNLFLRISSFVQEIVAHIKSIVSAYFKSVYNLIFKIIPLFPKFLFKNLIAYLSQFELFRNLIGLSEETNGMSFQEMIEEAKDAMLEVGDTYKATYDKHFLNLSKKVSEMVKDKSKEQQQKALEIYNQLTKLSVENMQKFSTNINALLTKDTESLKDDLANYIKETTEKYDVKSNKVIGELSNTQIKLLRGEIRPDEILQKLNSLSEAQRKLILDGVESKKTTQEKIEYLLNRVDRVVVNTAPERQPTNILMQQQYPTQSSIISGQINVNVNMPHAYGYTPNNPIGF